MATSRATGDPGSDRDDDGGARPGRGLIGAATAAAERLVTPAKAIRMLRALRRTLDELDQVDLDDEARHRVVEAHRATLIEVASTVSDALIGEMVALHIEPLTPAATLDQLKVAQAQLLGWVNGLVLAEANIKEPVAIGPVLAIDGTPFARGRDESRSTNAESPEPFPQPEPFPPPEPVPLPEPVPPPEPVPGPPERARRVARPIDHPLPCARAVEERDRGWLPGEFAECLDESHDQVTGRGMRAGTIEHRLALTLDQRALVRACSRWPGAAACAR